MIIFELIIFSTLSFFSIYMFAGLGQLILDQEEKNFFESFFFGFIVVTFILTLLHFFIKINLYVNFLVFLAGSYYSIKNFTLINYDYKKFFLLCNFYSFCSNLFEQKYHEDFGYIFTLCN